MGAFTVKGEFPLTEALHPRYTAGGNLYFAESGQYDQSEYWRVMAQTRDLLDQQLKQAAKSYTDTRAQQLDQQITAIDDAISLKTLGSTHLDSVIERGEYIQLSSSTVIPSNGYPQVNFTIGRAGTLSVEAHSGLIYQRYYMGAGVAFIRYRNAAGSWDPWVELGATPETVSTLGGNNLNDYTRTGTYRQTSSSNITPERNYPPVSGSFKAGTLFVISSGGGQVTQMYVADQAGEIWVRALQITDWRPWVQIGANIQQVTQQIEQGDSATLAAAKAYTDATGGTGTRTDMEITGRWTPTAQGDAFLLSLGNHEAVNVTEIGRSVEDRALYAAILGDPTNPAVIVTAGLHGTEVGPPEAAWLWVRELLQAKTMLLMDVCVIVVPCVNPDNRFIARGNKNAVDLNRDWLDLSQPETQAVAGLYDTHNIVAALDAHNFGYPRQVSLLGASYGPQAVQDLSQDLYDAVYAALEADGQGVRDYAPGIPPESLVQAVGANFQAAALLIEIPSGGYGTWTFDDYQPAPSWQAHVGMISFNTFAHHVWENLPAFESLKTV